MSSGPLFGHFTGAVFAPANTRLVFLAAHISLVMNTPAPLLPVGESPLLHRSMRQFHELGFCDQCVLTGYRATEIGNAALACFPETLLLHNACFTADVDSFSLLLALRSLEPGQGILVAEADTLVTDAAALAIARFVAGEESGIVACGPFVPGQADVLVLAGDNGRVSAMCSKNSADMHGWSAALGILYLAPQHVVKMRNFLEAFAGHGLQGRYADVWGDCLNMFPMHFWDVGREGGAPCNTQAGYARALQLAGATDRAVPEVTLLEVAALRHTEEFDRKRAAWLARKIRAEGVWTAPLAVSREHSLVMDGQHRLEAALHLGLRRVPAMIYEYAAVPVHSLRPGYVVTAEEIIARALACAPYPYKTAKHVLPLHPGCRVPLSELY